MHKSFITSALSAAVLVSGLLSCAPESTHRQKDVYTPTLPQLVHEGHAFDLRAWDQKATKELNLSDTIDLRAANAASARLSVDCGRAGRKDSTPDPRAAISLFQIVSDDLLLRAQDNPPETCAFSLELRNSLGSTHSFSFNSLVQGEAPATVSLSGETAGPLVVDPKHCEGIAVHFASETPAQSRIVCRDVRFNAVPFARKIDLSIFDFDKPEPRAPTASDPLGARPNQACRLLVEQGGLTLGLSAPFAIRFSRSPLVVRYEQPLAQTGRDRAREVFEALSLRPLSLHLSLQTVQLTNVTDNQRLVRIPAGSTADVILGVYGLTDSNITLARCEAARPYAHLSSAAPVLPSAGGGTVFAIEPHSGLNLDVLFEPERPFLSRLHGNQALSLLVRQALILEELDADFQLVDTLSISPPELSLFMGPVMSTEQLKAMPLDNHQCGWN